MSINALLENILHPPVLFFFLGMIAVAVRSDLEIPPQIARFLSIYLLFDIGIKGGEELFHSGFSFIVIKVIFFCVLLSFGIPFLVYRVLRLKLDVYNAGAIAATYGSISAVTFATGISYLESLEQSFGGYMVAGMALMESPAIIAGLVLVKGSQQKDGNADHGNGIKSMLNEAFFNGSVFLLVGSMVIGYLAGNAGEKELEPFVNGIFKGMLSLYMLDMGLLAARRLNELKKSGLFLVSFALLWPLFGACLGIISSLLIGLDHGSALLMTILTSSASYIAVPAAMRMAVPQANMSLLLPMSLGITFTFNVTLGIPLYYTVLSWFI